jgi:hypothetical protein
MNVRAVVNVARLTFVLRFAILRPLYVDTCDQLRSCARTPEAA